MMNNVKRLILIISGIIILVSTVKASELPFIVVSVRTLDNEYYHAIVKGAKMFAKSIGASDKLITLFSEGSSEKQVNDLRSTLKKTKNNAIVYFDPNESPVTTRLATISQQAGVYFATEWNKPTDIWPWDFNPYWVVHTSPDGFETGYETAKVMFESMKGKGNIIALQGRLGNSIAIARFKGLKKALKEYPDIELLDAISANWSRVEAMLITESLLSKYPKVHGIWAANDEMALGALELLRDMKKAGKIAVTGIDSTGDAVKAVIAGEMLCTLSPDPYWQVGMSLSFAYHAYIGKLKPESLPHGKRAFYIDTLLITQENAKQFLNKYVNGSPKIDYSLLWKNKWKGKFRDTE
jgi:ribose transport system substrate-binding protein